MPAPSETSADKKRQAQQARRQAAQRSSTARQPVKNKPVAKAVSVAPAVADPAPFNALQPETPKATDSRSYPDQADPVEIDTATSEADIDQICELVEVNPAALGPDANSVRQMCRNRRQALANKGKAASPGKGNGDGRRRSSKYSAAAAWMKGSVSSRDLARQRRADMAANGRGDEPVSRPSGRVRPKAAPPKVEVGTTLAGSEVTGTQVERTTSVTGNESGTCRVITGTEYIGSEQFETYCGTKPSPNPAKVGLSTTSSGMPVSGTKVGRSAKVTGDEPGSCAKVTGSEYIGSERLTEFCGSGDFSVHPAKVNTSQTEKRQVSVTGADEARINATTGSEAGAGRAITGSQYADVGAAKLTINGPSKVALTHTIAGRPVTGTEVGRSAKVTGDEQGSCRTVTGTEYISNEQFASICQTAPTPSPAKVGVDRTRNSQRITGNLVDRSDKVTGNEPGTCNRITGSQYGQSRLCGGAAPKAHHMQTLSGNSLTGNRVDHGPKLSGDELGGCLPVTGTEYYGKEQFAEHCTSTPAAKPAKVGVEHTAKGQHVSGTMVNYSPSVTGNEYGADHAVSGTPYAGMVVPESHGACCSSCAARQLAETAGLIAPKAATHPHNGNERYPVSAAVPQPEPQAPQDFSIVSPARAAQQQVTGSAFGGDRVTGPNNMASELVSGTPEFRYSPAAALTVPAAQMMPPAPEPAQPQRITGDGRDDGVSITGDNWNRSQQMTGTEGRWAQGRNPTLRGMSRGAVTNAHVNKQLERPQASTAMVTGSSGGYDDGALITVSGGARG
ncbi:MAG: carboxysome shell protein [Gammaproteobacteria bacterium]|nr:carboxysome shell protein [Gammaproteobacteria bacterium]